LLIIGRAADGGQLYDRPSIENTLVSRRQPSNEQRCWGNAPSFEDYFRTAVKMTGSLSNAIGATARFLRKELVDAWPVFLFFLIGFLLLISLIKLALANFSVEITAFSNALLGALIAAKAALVLDETPLARSLEHYRRIVAIAVKTVFYGLASLLLGYAERIAEALHEVHSFAGAIRHVIEHSNHYRVFAWALGISIVFALYFSFFEISLRMGKGALWALFFERPGSAKDIEMTVERAGAKNRI
jgi:hypothetical protein